MNRPITNNALDTTCTKTTSTPRAGGLAKPGHAASVCKLPKYITLKESTTICVADLFEVCKKFDLLK